MRRRTSSFASILSLVAAVVTASATTACATAVDDGGALPRADTGPTFGDANADVPIDQENDTGGSTDFDTGTPSADDTGTTPPDQDTGTPSSDDTGTTPPTDSGTPPTDSGSPPTDSGSPPTDTGPTCSKSPCDLFPQCGCSGSQACNIAAADGTTVCAAAGSGAVGAKCTEGTTGQCQKGLECVFGICQTLCGTTSDCPSNSACTAVSSSSGPIPGFDICAQNCNLKSPAGVCGSGGCSLIDTGVPVCTAAGSVGQNGACNSDPFSCKAGFVCLQETGPTDLQCLKWCTNPGGTCTGGLTCYGLNPAVTVGGTTYGVCDF